MRPIERVLVIGGVVLALILAVARGGGAAALARTPAAQQDFRLGTVDTYAVIERLMARPDPKKAREDLASTWAAKIEAVERDLQQFQDTLRVLQKDSPTFNETIQRAQARQAEYQKMGQDRQQELEKLNSSQLTDAYKQVRDATNAVAERLGYSHVLGNRSFDRPIEATTVASTLQELLARPLIRGNPADDITPQVMAELKLDAAAPEPTAEPKPDQ